MEDGRRLHSSGTDLEIRLLLLKAHTRTFRRSSTTAGLIQCTLESFDIEKCPPYVAVSYTWGPPDVCETVMVNGSPLRVRENLHAVLSILRSRLSTGFSEDPIRENKLMGDYFWVDAVCINQKDVHERGHQVNLMAQIFSTASCAVAWLGPESRNSALAINAIRTGNPRKVHQIQVDHRVYVNQYSRDRHEIQSALVSLLARPYWRRVWVIQEFAL
ncbi:heterokaryon incompatibility protein-domain-containing protein, partial [Coniella lustricola]